MFNDLASGNHCVLNRQENTSNLVDFTYSEGSSVHYMTRNDDGSGYHNYTGFKPNEQEWYYITLQREAGVAKRLFVNGQNEWEIDDPNSILTLPNFRIGNADDTNLGSSNAGNIVIDEPTNLEFSTYH